MVDTELRFAKLCKMINSSADHAKQNTIAYSEACKRAVEELHKSLNEEETTNLQLKRYWLQQKEKAEREKKRQQDLRIENMLFIKGQMREKRQSLKNESNWDSPDVNRSYGSTKSIENSMEKSIYEKKYEFKNQLDAQILENSKLLKEQKAKEEMMDKFMLESAMFSLEKDLKVKEMQKKKLQNQLKESWALSCQVKKLNKDINQLRNLKRFSYVDDLHPSKKFFREKINKSQISKSVASERLEFLLHKEKKIKKEKKKLTAYLETKRKSLKSDLTGSPLMIPEIRKSRALSAAKEY